MKRVITVHGISTNGEWQDELKAALEPHFECVMVRYTYYRRLGAFKVLFEPWLLTVGLTSLALLRIFSQAVAWHYIVIVLAILVTSFFGARFRRQSVARQFKAQIDTLVNPGERPHIIAHSFGTLLLGTILNIFPNAKFEAIVLTGCVLPASFEWSLIKQRNRWAFTRIRNEVAGADLVVRMAYTIRMLIPALGDSGLKGFRPDSPSVHTITNANETCATCDAAQEKHAPLHNVVLKDFRHSDVFVGCGHAQSYWLPFFWNIDPCEYQFFVDLCSTAATLQEEGDYVKLRVIEREFRERRWKWAGGTLKDYAENQLRNMLNYPPEQPLTPELHMRIARAIALVWRGVEDARNLTKPSAHTASCLYPKVAVCKAIRAVIS